MASNPKRIRDYAKEYLIRVPTSVPEPSTAFLLVIGLFAVAVSGRWAATNARFGLSTARGVSWRGAPS
jgi:PEP-CTERM motif